MPCEDWVVFLPTIVILFVCFTPDLISQEVNSRFVGADELFSSVDFPSCLLIDVVIEESRGVPVV